MLFALWQIEISRAEGLLHSKGEAHLPGIPVDMPGLIRCQMDTIFILSVLKLYWGRVVP
jgi:hypothetical protein